MCVSISIDFMKKPAIKLNQILSFITCFLIILAISLQRDGKFWGNTITNDDKCPPESAIDAMKVLPDGTSVINTSTLAKDVTGYSGTTPLEIYIKFNKIVNVKALKNTETPDFFSRASVILKRWEGMTLNEASKKDVDAVSGATMSSRSIISNMKCGIQFAQNNNISRSFWDGFDNTPKAIIGLIVAFMAAIIPLFIKNKKYRIIQQILNVSVLGFWCGTFISYSSIIGYMSNGINIVSMLIPLVLVITAFVYPLFGKKTYYCTNVCPFGSLQELSLNIIKYRLKLSTKTLKRLDVFRQILWALLMFCIWTGLWSDWIDFEPFSTFIFQSASWIVIGIAVFFVLLSTVITRPYCRFVCPTGTILKISQLSK